MEQQIQIIDLGSYKVSLKFIPFDTDVDLDDLCKIHHDNLFGEIVSISVLMNRVGILRAEAQDLVRKEELSTNLVHAQLSQHYRGKLSVIENDRKKRATNDQVNGAVLMDQRWINQQKRFINVQKQYDVIDSLYWAVKSKDQKLNRLADSLTPKEYESSLIEGVVNSILIKKHSKHIK